MTSNTGIELRMERILNAPPRTVFTALTSKEAIPRWFGPSDDFDIVVHEWDCRKGGRYRVQMNAPDGETHIVGGEFRSVVPDRELSYTWSWEGQPPMDSLVTFALEADGEGTALRFTHTGFPTEDHRSSHEQGWTGSLSRLGREVEG